MSRRYRERRPARNKSLKESKPLILVVTEGKNTEPQYLHGFITQVRNPRVKVEIKTDGGVPKSVVEYARDLKKEAEKRAKRERDDNLLFDEVWCVFDIDEHPRIPDAIQQAHANNLKLAISNPCIELWLWLHFAEPPGIIHRHDIQKSLKKYLPDYDKHVDFSDFKSGYSKAVERANWLDELAKQANDEGRNPTTGFGRLTESILEENKSNDP